MRITNRLIVETSLNDLQKILRKLLGVQEKLSSGKRVNRPSDDPFSTHKAISSRGAVVVLEQFSRNIEEIRGWVSATDSTLSTVTEALREVRTLAIQAANSTLSPSDRENIALRIDEYKEMVFQLSGERYNGRYLFSGTRTMERPFTWNGEEVVYGGNDAHMKVNIGSGTEISFNLTGREVFMGEEAGEGSVFGLLNRLARAVREGDLQEVSGLLLQQLDRAAERVTEKQGIIGSTEDRLERMKEFLAGLVERERGQLSEEEEIDLAEAVMDLQLNNTAYQSSLASCARVILPSLLDYLR